ncbi:MAG: DUF3410 domain-containing protein, partial [Sedimentisphaerales bacterium]|nr:DUF3410 domain-containing protein [Sedimentisphaerales bacterium]
KQLKKGKLGPVVLDVWENEPEIDVELLDKVAIGTPHISGYSYDGKINGTVMLYRAVCEFLDTQDELNVEKLMPRPPVPEIVIEAHQQSDQQLLTQAMSRIYDIMGDDSRLREIIQQQPGKRGKIFDVLRKNYPIRREAFNTRIKLQAPANQIREKLTILGFKT